MKETFKGNGYISDQETARLIEYAKNDVENIENNLHLVSNWLHEIAGCYPYNDNRNWLFLNQTIDLLDSVMMAMKKKEREQ